MSKVPEPERIEQQILQVPKTERVEFATHPVTLLLRKLLLEEAAAIRHAWMHGEYSQEEATATIQLNSEAIGTARALTTVEEMIATLPIDDDPEEFEE